MENIHNNSKDISADGLRGIASLSVVLCHFFISFYPLGFEKLYAGSAATSAISNMFTSFLQIPILSVFWNGTFAVSIFFVLSGYVLTKSFYATGNIYILKTRLAKRYFRFLLPVLMSVMLSWVILSNGMGFWREASGLTRSWWLWHFWAFEPSLFNALKDGLYSAIFTGQSSYTPPLWTMRIELVGSIIVLSYSALKTNGKSEFILLTLVLIFLYSFSPVDATYYVAFILGSYINKVRFVFSRLSTALLLLVSLYLGGYENSFIYDWVRSIFGEGLIIRQVMTVCGGFILVLLVSNGLFNRFLESSAIQLLGRMSFSIYLVHFPIILSWSSFVFVSLYINLGMSLAVLASFIVTLPIIFLVAWVFMKLFDESSTKLAKLIVSEKKAIKSE